MDKINQSKEDFVLSLIVKAVLSFREKLDQDIDLKDKQVYMVCFLHALMAMAKKHRPPFSMSITGKITKGKVIENDKVIDNHIWIELEKFPIDLTLPKEEKERCKLEFAKGIIEKIKKDVQTHYPEQDMEHNMYAKFMSGSYSFRTEGTQPLSVYVHGLFTEKS